MSGKLLILTALQFEAAAIARRLPPGETVELLVIGPGGGRVLDAVPVERCRGIIMAGLAGALDPTLRIGDVVVDQQSTLPLVEQRWRRGEFHTAVELIAKAAQKQALFAATGALVVEMENSIARAFASGYRLPFLGIRAVSDRADEPLDPAALRWIGADGGLRPGRLAADLCLRPCRIGAMWRLGRQSRVALRNLSEAVQQVVATPQVRAPGDSLPCGSTA